MSVTNLVNQALILFCACEKTLVLPKTQLPFANTIKPSSVAEQNAAKADR